ncbi:MAG: hypothetical protein K2Q26_12570 [Bdellovibrionales bacterium]|nr:hypothetical protein [Bdellovibrionales bacterium]
MSDYIKEQRQDIRILNTVRIIVEKGNLSFVADFLEKKADTVIRSTVEKLFHSAVGEYVRDNTGGAFAYSGISSIKDILEPQEFGQNYWGKKIQEEIDKKRNLIVDLEYKEVASICG